MMDILVGDRGAAAIPISIGESGPQEPGEWAAHAGAEYAAVSDVPPEVQQRIQSALTVLAQEDAPDLQQFLLVGVDGTVLASMRIVLAASEFTREEQAEFLWPPALIPPITLRVETEHLGVGVSSTLARREDGKDVGSRRWLFFGEGMTVGAVVGPIAPYLLSVVEPVADAVMNGFRVEGFTPSPHEERVAELVSAVSTIGDSWAL